MSNKNYSTHLSTYKEADALQQLIVALNDALSDERFEQHEKDVMNDQFTITVNGVQTAFYLGGPQAEGLFAFVKHIADENFYEVDINKGTVVGD
jgi:hypothetical protein